MYFAIIVFWLSSLRMYLSSSCFGSVLMLGSSFIVFTVYKFLKPYWFVDSSFKVLKNSRFLRNENVKLVSCMFFEVYFPNSSQFNEIMNALNEFTHGSNKQKCVHTHNDIRVLPRHTKYEAIKQRVLCTRYLDHDTIVNHKFHHRYVHCVQQFNHCCLFK